MFDGKTIRIKLHDMLSFIALFVAFLCATSGALRYTESQLVYYLPFVLCLAALIMELMVRRIVVSSYLIWRILVAVFLLATLTYAIDFDVAFVGVKTYLLQSVVVLLIAVKCSDDPANIKKIMVLGVLACLTTTLYILTMVDPSQITDGQRLGVSTVNSKWNANNIGVLTAFGMLLMFCVAFVYTRKIKRWQAVACVILTALFGYIMIMSGSRKSLLIILVTMLLYIMRSQKSKRVRNTLLAIILVLLALYAIYNVPFLYQHVGVRIEAMVEAMFGGYGDKSAQLRQNMVDIGLDAFKERPIFGYGVNAFSIFHEQKVGYQAYAHNNYVELLVTGGLVGTALYYAYIGKILFKKCTDNKQTSFIKAIGVSYYDPFIQYVLCLLVYSVIYNPTVTRLYDREAASLPGGQT